MGRRKNNPELVKKLIEGRWTMSDSEFERLYHSLSFSDMCKVARAIDNMVDEFVNDSEDEYYTDEDDSD